MHMGTQYGILTRILIALALAVIYPSFGLTLIVVLAAEAILNARRKQQTQPAG